MVTCPSTNPSICQRERKSSVGSSVSIAKQKISLMLWFEWKLNWWNHFPMNDISVCMLFCLFFFVPPTFLHVAAFNFDCVRLCVTWCVRFPQSFINVLCVSFCSDCFYQVLCFLVSLCSHSKQHQYGLLLVLFTSLCYCLCISVFLFKALSMQLAIASINFFSKQPLAPVCPGRFSPHDSSLFQPVSHHISNRSYKFQQLAKY